MPPEPSGTGTEGTPSVVDAGSARRGEATDVGRAQTPPADQQMRERRASRVAMLRENATPRQRAALAAAAPSGGAQVDGGGRSWSGWLAAALTLALVGWMASGMLGETPEAPVVAAPRAAEPEPIAVEVVRSLAEPIERALTIEGEVAPALSTPVRAQAGGTIDTIEARKGAPIEAGDVIARIAPAERDAQLAQARDAVAAARAEFERAQSLVDRGFTTRSRLEQAQSGLRSAEAQLASVEAGFDDLVIRAPASGVLNALEIDAGEVVQAGAEVATIVDTTRLLVEINVPQRAIADVERGREATVEFVTGQTRTGLVTFVAANAESATRTFPVEIEVANPERDVPSGISAEVRLPIETIEAHFVSPAILSLGETGALGVKVAEAIADGVGTVGFYPAELVRAETGGIWVAGLPDDATIITVGQGFVATGERVAAVAEGDAPTRAPEARVVREERIAGDAPAVVVTSTGANQSGGEVRAEADVTVVGTTSEIATSEATSPGVTPVDANETVRTVAVDTSPSIMEQPEEAAPEPVVVPTDEPIDTRTIDTGAIDTGTVDTATSGGPSPDPAPVEATTIEVAPIETQVVPIPDPSEIIAAAQERLNELGYDLGPVTGEENPRTRVAVGRFQADEGLPVSGDLTGRTLAALAVDPATAGIEAGGPPDGAVALDAPLSVAATQTALNDLGFDAGPADGILGQGTRSAIRAFQEANGLDVTGQPSPELSRALRAAARS